MASKRSLFFFSSSGVNFAIDPWTYTQYLQDFRAIMPGLASAGSNAAHGKSEILNPKHETNPKCESQMFKTKQGP
ncbi:MAG: hypothetical protein P8X46_13820, partial [Nitrospirales bacterium]